MDISGASASSIAQHLNRQDQAQAQTQAQMSMFKKAIDTQADNAMALVESIPSPTGAMATPSQALPSNLGQNINTSA